MTRMKGTPSLRDIETVGRGQGAVGRGQGAVGSNN